MRHTALLILCVLFVVSCSDSGTTVDDDPNAGIPVGTLTRTITPDGGTMKTRASSDGPVFTLTFPAGAVRSPIDITIDPLSPDAGLWFDLDLEPAGLVFFEPVEMFVELPEGTGLADAQMMFLRTDDFVYIPTTVNAETRTLSTSLNFFGYTEDGSRVIPFNVVGAPPAQAGGGNNVGGGPVNCQAVIASAQARFDTYVATEMFQEAVDMALAIAGLLERATCFAEAADWVNTAKELACTQLTEAVNDAISSPTSNYGDFAEQTNNIVNWVPVVLRVDPDCAALNDYQDALANEIPDFLAFYEPRLDALTANDWETFSDLKDEAVSVMEVSLEAEMLGLNATGDMIYDEAFVPTLDRMRTVAFTMCNDHGWHYPLSRLTATGFFAARDIIGQTPPRPGSLNVVGGGGFASFSDSDIFADMQMCATDIDIQTKVSSGGQLTAGNFEATAPGTAIRHVEIDCPTRGTIVLSGKLGAFTCWNDLRADDEMTVNFNFDDVLTIPRPANKGEYLLGFPVELDILETAQATGFTPKEGFSTDLVVTRNRADCDDRMWGDADTEVFRATLNWKNPTAEVELAVPDTVDAGSATPVTVRVKVIDLLGNAGFFEAVDLVLNVTGGTAGQTTGQTDANGEFTTTITPDGRAPSPGPNGASAQGFSITATATTFEGVTAQKTETATVLQCDAEDHGIRESGSGNYTIDSGYRDARVWASAPAGEYHLATHEASDDFVVTPADASLIGQRGYVHIKVRYRFESSGYSTSRPAARVVIGYRNGFSSPYFWTANFNTPSAEPRIVEEEWEIPISCTFGRVSAPLEVNVDAFAKANDDGPSMVSAEVTWIGITKVTQEDGTVVGSYKMCTASGTDYR